jgi:cob(I)alamin adenosyltransferase
MAIHLNRIYTRSGDLGQTSLACGTRVSKNELRVKTYGCCDELNTHVGLLRTIAEKEAEEIRNFSLHSLQTIQQQLFNAGSVLATRKPEIQEQYNLLSIKDVEFLEKQIDLMNTDLSPLQSFTLPGGSVLNANSHICRTVCRRLECLMVELIEFESIPPIVMQYINRLSDWFYVYSRWVCKKAGIQEYLWSKEAQF